MTIRVEICFTGTISKDGIPIGVGSTVSYSISVSHHQKVGPVYDSSVARSGKGAQIVADVVQSDTRNYIKVRKACRLKMCVMF